MAEVFVISTVFIKKFASFITRGLFPWQFVSYLLSAKPIDLLAQYVSSDDNDLEIQMHEPCTILVVSGGILSLVCIKTPQNFNEKCEKSLTMIHICWMF